MSATIVNRARTIVANWEAQCEEYAAECAQNRRDGYAPSACFHGRNLWVDYDVICGHCEDGIYTQHSTRGEIIAYAINMAHAERAQARAARTQQNNRHLALLELVKSYRGTERYAAAARIMLEILHDERAARA